MSEPTSPEPTPSEPSFPLYPVGQSDSRPPARPTSGRNQTRIGDTERNRAVELLQDHVAAGRLTSEEFDDRVGVALAAKTLADLKPLFVDLPGPNPGKPADESMSLAEQNRARAEELMAQAKARNEAQSLAETPRWNTPLTVLTAVMWPATFIVLFATSWDYWWLIFIPVAISSILGKNHRDRDQERRQIERDQERLDQRRRAIGD